MANRPCVYLRSEHRLAGRSAMSAGPPILIGMVQCGRFPGRATSATRQTRIIRLHVVSLHLKSVVAAEEIAAMLHVGAGFRLLAPASKLIASINGQKFDRAF